jgi:hypothetical protein
MDNRRRPYMQTIYKSLQAADLDKLEYVTLISLDFKQQTRGRSQGWCTVGRCQELVDQQWWPDSLWRPDVFRLHKPYRRKTSRPECITRL